MLAFIRELGDYEKVVRGKLTNYRHLLDCLNDL